MTGRRRKFWKIAIQRAWCVCLAALGSATYGAGQIESEQAVLKKFGITCDASGLREYFDSLTPRGDLVARAQALVVELGDEDFKKREKAMATLLAIPNPPIDVLRAAAESADPETRWRAAHCLKEAGASNKNLLRSALAVVEKTPIKGLCGSVMKVTASDDSPDIQRAAQRALHATLQADDERLLVESLRRAEPRIRIMALRGLTRLRGKAAAPEVAALLNDPEERVRLYAAAELANRGDREALFALERLLHSESLALRGQSSRLLKGFAGKSFGFVAFDAREKREAAAAEWLKWLRTDGAASELKQQIDIDSGHVGRILVAYFESNVVVEYDEARKVVWEASVPQPWGCSGMPNGHRLVTSFGTNFVIEFDASGNEVWRASGPNPTYAERLENGNTLICLYGQRQVLEMTPDHRTVRAFSVGGAPTFAQRTSDGRTLVSTQGAGGLEEYDSKGERVPSTSLPNAQSGRRLANGNLLVVQAGQLRELDSSNSTVWKAAGVANIMNAIRLENGNTLIAGQNGVVEVDSDGKSVWTDSRGRAFGISEY